MITITNQSICITHYKKILNVSLNSIHIEMNKINISIVGNDLFVYFMNKDEIILRGMIQKVEFVYHESI